MNNGELQPKDTDSSQTKSTLVLHDDDRLKSLYDSRHYQRHVESTKSGATRKQ